MLLRISYNGVCIAFVERFGDNYNVNAHIYWSTAIIIIIIIILAIKFLCR